MDQPRRYVKREQFDGRSGGIPLGDVSRRAAQKLPDDTVAEVQLPRPAEIDNSSERYRPDDLHFPMGCEPEGELASGRIAEYNNAGQIEQVFGCELVNVSRGSRDVFRCARPTAALISQ